MISNTSLAAFSAGLTAAPAPLTRPAAEPPPRGRPLRAESIDPPPTDLPRGSLLNLTV